MRTVILEESPSWNFIGRVHISWRKQFHLDVWHQFQKYKKCKKSHEFAEISNLKFQMQLVCVPKAIKKGVSECAQICHGFSTVSQLLLPWNTITLKCYYFELLLPWNAITLKYNLLMSDKMVTAQKASSLRFWKFSTAQNESWLVANLPTVEHPKKKCPQKEPKKQKSVKKLDKM